MHRYRYLPLLVLVILVGCGKTVRVSVPSLSTPTGTNSTTTTLGGCHPRVPPSLGECVSQRYGFRRPGIGLTAPSGVAHGQCVDLSQWQGYYPSLAGLRCVIIQATYGLNVEPSVYSQIQDANAHHVPWGAYAFMEGDSGSAEARLATSVTNGRGRTLGVWADAEVGPAYSHACAFTSETRTLGVNVYGLFAAPGMFPSYDGPCAGYLWPSEWGLAGPYPFAGYGYAAIKLWQDCGQCFRYGVEIDLDQDFGLIALAHPSPPPETSTQRAARERRELHAAEHTRRVLHRDIDRHRCRPGQHNLPRHPERLRLIYHSICGRWLKQGGREIALEGRLRRAL